MISIGVRILDALCTLALRLIPDHPALHCHRHCQIARGYLSQSFEFTSPSHIRSIDTMRKITISETQSPFLGRAVALRDDPRNPGKKLPAKTDGPIKWAILSEKDEDGNPVPTGSIATLSDVPPDGSTARITPTGALGSFICHNDADADLDPPSGASPEYREIDEDVLFVVEAAEASALRSEFPGVGKESETAETADPV